MSKNKKVGARATNSVSRKTFAEDVYSAAGDTTIPSYKEGDEKVDSIALLVYSVANNNATETEENNF